MFLVLPNSLFPDLKSFKKGTKFIFFEDFTHQHHLDEPLVLNKLRLAFHRATMRYAYDQLKKKYPGSIYIEHHEEKKFLKLLKKTKVGAYLPPDKSVKEKLDAYNVKYKQSPMFLLTEEDLEEYLAEDIKDHYFQTNFYRYFREKLDILMNKGKPEGGKLTYDSENRKKLPKDIDIPEPFEDEDQEEYIEEAVKYVEEYFPDNPGTIENFIFPITREGWLKQLENFVENRLNNFGPYQDAFLIPNLPEELLLFHSGLSPALNSGLLTPQEVIDAVLDKKDSVSLESVEGFIRQVLGWREFTRFVYLYKGDELIHQNFLNNEKQLSGAWYTGEIGIEPVDDAILTAFSYGYLHHIQRLMVIGNFMNLVGLHPDEIYRWFYEFSLDSYDWVMVFNTYSMVSYADGGALTTKPYISGSNYLLKMSNYPKDDWCQIWDDLYYRFLHIHRDKLGNNPRMFYMYGHYRKKTDIKQIVKRAEKFIESL